MHDNIIFWIPVATMHKTSLPCTCLQPPPPARWFLSWQAAKKKWRLLTNAPISRKPTNRIFSNCRTLLRYTINAVTISTTTAIVQRRESHAVA